MTKLSLKVVDQERLHHIEKFHYLEGGLNKHKICRLFPQGQSCNYAREMPIAPQNKTICP